ncbi:unnamed protein product, partial [Timema podura]|nr:unnamed protein product [Timema podura]
MICFEKLSRFERKRGVKRLKSSARLGTTHHKGDSLALSFLKIRLGAEGGEDEGIWGCSKRFQKAFKTKNVLSSTPDRDSNPNLVVIGGQFYCESSAIEQITTGEVVKRAFEIKTVLSSTPDRDSNTNLVVIGYCESSAIEVYLLKMNHGTPIAEGERAVYGVGNFVRSISNDSVA